MVTEVLVDSKTRWICVGSGRCCHLLGKEVSLSLFGKAPQENGACVKLDEKKRCSIYSERPMGCKMYPFYPDWEKLKRGKVDFSAGSLKIDSECPGYMQGDLVLGNKKIQKKLYKVAVQLAKNLQKKKQGKLVDLFLME